jgi:pilus assembly protein Flp/PilA
LAREGGRNSRLSPSRNGIHQKGEQQVVLQKTYGFLFNLRARLERQDGQALVEYALILALIAVVSIVVLQLLGVNVSRIFNSVNTALSAVGT